MSHLENNNNQIIIKLVDTALKDISGQQMVPTSFVSDLLLDIRLQLLISDSTPDYTTSI